MKTGRHLLRWCLLLLGLIVGSCHQAPGTTALQDGSMTDTAPSSRPNLTLPTLGGKQLWADVRWKERWRVQQNVLTGHFRLLDPQDRRLAWGEFEACALRMQELAPEPPAQAEHLILLLHGMGRSRSAFAKMQKRLEEMGFHVGSLSYPSTRRSIEAHAAQVAEVLEHLEGYSSVSFVTHSLGGIVVRRMLADDGPWRARLKATRLVMLGPPNQGAAFADQVQEKTTFRWIFGDTGQGLTSNALATLPSPDIPFLVIAGARGDGTDKGWNPMLQGDDDGVVRVTETHLTGQAAHFTVPVFHTFLMNDDPVIESIAAFLADGSLVVPEHALSSWRPADDPAE